MVIFKNYFNYKLGSIVEHKLTKEKFIIMSYNIPSFTYGCRDKKYFEWKFRKEELKVLK